MRKKIWTCAKISLIQLFASTKWRFILCIAAIFCFYTYMPFFQIARFYEIGIAPWIYCFFRSFYLMIVLHGALSILLFVEVPYLDMYTEMLIIRSGRFSYILGQFLYICLAAGIYTLIPLLMSLVFVIPRLDCNWEWGMLINTLSESSAVITSQTGIELSFVIDPEILNLNPLQAMGITFVFEWLVTLFIGCVMLFFRLLVGKMGGIIAAGVLVGMTMFAMFLGGILIGSWLIYISPASWCSIGLLDWFGGGAQPSPTYALIVLSSGIFVMGTGSVLKFIRNDLESRS